MKRPWVHMSSPSRSPLPPSSPPTVLFIQEVGFPGGSEGQESACISGDLGLIPGLGGFPGGKKWQPTPLFLPGESPWTEEPSGPQSLGVTQSQTRLNDQAHHSIQEVRRTESVVQVNSSFPLLKMTCL